MYLEIITPDKKIFEGEVNFVQLPGSKGSFTMLKNNAPIISTVEKGKITVIAKYESSKESRLTLKTGE